MENKIIIKTLPFELTKKEEMNENWRFKKMTALQNLEVSSKAIKTNLESNIPVSFKEEVILTISINKFSMKTKLDWSETKSKQAVRLAKSYLSGDQLSFVKELMKIV